MPAIKDLPYLIKKRVRKLQKEITTANKHAKTLIEAIPWTHTEEGRKIWHEVHKGNYKPWYDYWNQ